MAKAYPIVASNHIKGAEDFIKTLPSGVQAVLVAQPTNPFDPNAVMVWVDGRHIGFVPKNQNKALFQFVMQSGVPYLGIPDEHLMAMDAVAGSGAGGNPNPLHAVGAKFVRSPNSNYPMVEV